MPFQLSHILHDLYHFTEFFKLNVWYYNVTHLYEVDYRLLSHISSYLYEIFMELFLSRQNDQIAPVLDTCGCHCVVSPYLERLLLLKVFWVSPLQWHPSPLSGSIWSFHYFIIFSLIFFLIAVFTNISFLSLFLHISYHYFTYIFLITILLN